jgi:hypothetical protein
MNDAPVYVPPILESLRDKADALDWETLPPGRCDLNYRPKTMQPRNDALWACGLLLLVTTLSLPIALMMRHLAGPAISTWGGFFWLALIVGAILALYWLIARPWEKDRHGAPADPMKFTLVLALAPVFAWLITIATPLTLRTEGALLIFCLFALPFTIWVADGISTHAVSWMTAHPQIDHATMLGWRTDWSMRWLTVPPRSPRRNDLDEHERALHETVLRHRSSYLNGLIWLLGSVLVPSGIVLFAARHTPRHVTGLSLAMGILGALFVSGLHRTLRWPGAFRHFTTFLVSYVTYGMWGRYPPWVFQSPGGLALYRQLLAILALFLVTATFLPLADHFRWVYLGTPSVHLLVPETVQGIEKGGFQAVWEVLLAAVRGHGYTSACVVMQGTLCLLTPGIAFLLILFLISGPAIAAHHAALEAPGAYEQHSEWSSFDGYIARLHASRNATERDSLLIGRHPVRDYPILLHSDLLFEHLHMLGGTGTGKTSLGLMTHLIQLIRRGDGAVIIIDGKGDDALFHTARLEAERSGRKFKHFTNKPHRSTYVFNPFNQEVLRELTIPEILGLLINFLNLHHGSDYGRAWFTILSRILLKHSVEETLPNGSSRARRPSSGRFGTIHSFRDLNEIILYLSQDGKEYQAAQHLAFLVESLADFEQLNLSPNRTAAHPALEHAISMPEVLREKQVVYFYLLGAMDVASVAEIGRLAVYSLLAACIVHKDQTFRAPRAYCICDEAQTIVAQNIQHGLTQARSHGLAFILAHQTMSQLNQPGGVDLRELIMGCTSVKQIFSARDPWLQRYISDMSGCVRYASFSYDQTLKDVTEGVMGVSGAKTDELTEGLVNVTEVSGPRLTAQDIQDVNRHDNLCILGIERSKGYSRWHGYSPIYIDWSMTQAEYRARSEDLPWPLQTDGTLMIRPEWPAPTAETTVATTHPPLLPPAAPEDMSERLRDLRRRLDEE